jgi:hypothetical protein
MNNKFIRYGTVILSIDEIMENDEVEKVAIFESRSHFSKEFSLLSAILGAFSFKVPGKC